MDTLVVDPAIQDVLGRNIGHVGLDNTDCFDIDLLDQYLQNDKTCLPEDTIPAIAYRPIQSLPNHQPHISQVIPHTSSPPQIPTTNYNHMRNHAILNGQNHCYDNPVMHPTLPDSPPDSEPYSPPDGHHNPQIVTSQENKYGVNPVMHHMYPPSHHRPPGIHTKSMTPGYNEPPVLNHMPPSVATHPDPSVTTPIPLTASGMNPQMISPPHSISSRPAKRKYPDSPSSTLTNALMNGRHDILPIKQEPSSSFGGYLGDCDEEYQYDPDSSNSGFMDSSYQVIKWSPFNMQKWTVMTDSNLKDLPPPHYRIDSDKGFNFSTPDEAFVCQKKNHFQVTAHMSIAGDPKYVRTPEGVKKIDSFYLHFYGVKVESQSQMIKIEQSQSDRSKKPFYPVRVDLIPNQTNKMTVGRLHFSETTSNNMRKKGRPNPDQRYFMLVVALHAHCGDNDYMVAAQSSERLIVRASNPGQFDNDVDIMWQKAQTPDGIYHVGRVGVNTDHPEEALTVHGNMRLTGHLLQPSDQRVKTDIKEVNSRDQLKNVAKLNMYKYKYKDDFADTVGLPEHQREDTGVLAQEVKCVLPDAVMETGDVALNSGKQIDNLLVVNKDRIFMENVGAVKELCKLTDNLEVRIDELEKMNKRLSKLKRYDSLKSTISTKSSCSVSTIGSTPPKKSSSPSHKYRQPSSHHHSNKKSVSPPDNGWCSNKFIQIVIITLILIMAFCLVAITVLYILEKHTDSQETTSSPFSNGLSRPQDVTSSKSPLTPQPITGAPSRTITSQTPSQTTQKPSTTTRGGGLPMIPIIQWQGDDCEPGLCEPYCCPPLGQDDGPGMTYDPSQFPSLWPYLYPNLHQPDENNNTEMNGTTGTGDKETNELPGEGDKETNALPGEDKTTTKDPLDNNLPTVPTVLINNSDGTGPGYINVGNIDTNVVQNTILSRNKRQAADSLNADVIVGFGHGNVTLGPLYCDRQMPHPCRDRNNTYILHYSEFWRLNKLFSVNFRVGINMGVELCYNYTHAMCAKTEFDGLEQTGPTQWRLPVTQFFFSHYRFRVARQGTPSVCSLGADSLVDFSEYTIKFVRYCSQGHGGSD